MVMLGDGRVFHMRGKGFKVVSTFFSMITIAYTILLLLPQFMI